MSAAEPHIHVRRLGLLLGLCGACLLGLAPPVWGQEGADTTLATGVGEGAGGSALPEPQASPDTTAPASGFVVGDTGPDNTAYHLLIDPAEQTPAWQQLTLLYAMQWGYYVVGQRKSLMEHGSFHNWVDNMNDPHFDKDFYDFNLIQHTLAGTLYYGYYRSFGSTRKRSLVLSTMSVLLFEFTIEVATERPSFQDIYQTPVLGALVGMGLEDLSLVCLGSSHQAVRALGYALNPYTLVPGSAWQVKLVPKVGASGLEGGNIALLF